MPNIEIVGTVTVGTSEEAAYAEVLEKIDELQDTIDELADNAITTNGEFDDTIGWWTQVQNGHTITVNGQDVLDLGDKRGDSIIVHKRELSESYLNLDVSPAIVTQTIVNYSNNGGQNFTRMTSAYHEVIGQGTVSILGDEASPNFTPAGVSCYNKFKGNCGMNGIIARIDDVHYTDTELGISPNDIDGTTGLGTSKSCGMGAIVQRRSDYSQGRHHASYSIGIESVVYNFAEEDGVEGTSGYFGNDDDFSYRTWTNCLHLVGGSRRPITAGILINGKSSIGVKVDADGMPVYDSAGNVLKDANGNDRVVATGDAGKGCVRNGMYNGIVIGASAMRIRSVADRDANGNLQYDENNNLKMTLGNSHLTVGINTASWKENGAHGFTFLKAGYAPRILVSRGSALFETPGVKFLNPNGNMPVAISCVDEYTYKDDNNQTQTAHGTPYLDFKIGSASDFYEENNIPKERPTDTTRARVGYLQSVSSLNVSSDGAIKFITSRDFSDSEAETLDFTMSSNGFYPSEKVNLGSANYFWDNAFVRKGAINIADSEKYRDTSSIVRPSTAGNTEVEKLLTAWGNIGYKLFKFTDTGSKKHIGLTAQDIATEFTVQGLTASDYGLYFTTTSGSTTTYGVRYNECLAMECAYLRDQLNSIKSRLTALEGA